MQLAVWAITVQVAIATDNALPVLQDSSYQFLILAFLIRFLTALSKLMKTNAIPVKLTTPWLIVTHNVSDLLVQSLIAINAPIIDSTVPHAQYASLDLHFKDRTV